MNGILREVTLVLVLLAYFAGLLIWTPLFLLWPRRYDDLTYAQTVTVRWRLAHHIWTRSIFQGR